MANSIYKYIKTIQESSEEKTSQIEASVSIEKEEQSKKIPKVQEKKKILSVLVILIVISCIISVGYYFISSTKKEKISLNTSYLSKKTPPALSKNVQSLRNEKEIKVRKEIKEDYLKIAQNFFNIGDLEQTSFYLLKALNATEEPYKKVLLMNDLGATYLLMNKCKLAEDVLRKALKTEEIVEAKLNLVLALLCQGKIKEGKKILKGDFKNLSPEAEKLYRELLKELKIEKGVT